MKSTVRSVACLLALLTAASSVSAAVFTWDGKGSGSNLNDWNKQQNWAGNIVPGTADEALFSTTLNGNSLLPTISAATGIGLVHFGVGGTNITIGGVGPLTLNAIAGVGIQNDNVTRTETFTVSSILLGANQAWNNSGVLNFTGSSVNLSTRSLTINNSGTLTMTGGTINDAGSSLTLAGAGTTTIGDVISGAGGTLTKSGSGALTLSGINTYSGLSTIGGGTVSFSGSGQLGSGGVVLNGGTLSVDSDTRLGTGNGALTLGAATLSTSGTFTSPRAVSLTGGGTISSAGALTLSGVISGTGGFTKSGAGSLSLSGANSYQGATVLSAGTLTADSTTAFGNSSDISLANATLGLNANVTAPGSLTLGTGAILNQNTSVSSFGNLAVSGNSTINLGASGSLTFPSASYTGGLLSINNWNGPAWDDNNPNAGGAAAGIFITSDPTSSGLLTQVQFAGPNGPYPIGASWNSGTGELTPVPEPQFYAAAFALGLLGFAFARRRFAAPAKA